MPAEIQAISNVGESSEGRVPVLIERCDCHHPADAKWRAFGYRVGKGQHLAGQGATTTAPIIRHGPTIKIYLDQAVDRTTGPIGSLGERRDKTMAVDAVDEVGVGGDRCSFVRLHLADEVDADVVPQSPHFLELRPGLLVAVFAEIPHPLIDEHHDVADREVLRHHDEGHFVGRSVSVEAGPLDPRPDRAQGRRDLCMPCRHRCCPAASAPECSRQMRPANRQVVPSRR